MSYPVSINDLAERCFENSKAHGFWRQPNTEVLPSAGTYDFVMLVTSKLCLIHSEVSEALEDLRSDPFISKITESYDGKPMGFSSELADIIIRVLDLAEFLKIDIQQEVINKMKYNESRSYMHGGKAL